MGTGAFETESGPLSEAAARAVRERLAAHPPRRILAICREHIGDIVNTTGALRSLRSTYPPAILVAEVGERATAVLEGATWIDEVWTRPTHQGILGKLKSIARMRSGNFDLGVVLDDSNPHIVYVRLAGIPTRAGVWRGQKNAEHYSCAAPYRTDRCETRDNFSDLLSRIFGGPVDVSPVLPVAAHHITAADRILEAAGCPDGTPLIGLHPGASIPQKRWPIEQFVCLTKSILELGWRPVVVGGPDDRARGDEIARTHPGVIDLTGTTSILELAALCRRLRSLVTNDTGALHIAASQGTRCVALYGPTDPIAFSPWGDGHRIMVGKCACDKKSEAVCSGVCMAGIRSTDVMLALKELV